MNKEVLIHVAEKRSLRWTLQPKKRITFLRCALQSDRRGQEEEFFQTGNLQLADQNVMKSVTLSKASLLKQKKTLAKGCDKSRLNLKRTQAEGIVVLIGMLVLQANAACVCTESLNACRRTSICEHYRNKNIVCL